MIYICKEEASFVDLRSRLSLLLTGMH